MNEEVALLNRPPIGFVVEGHGEYNCYPSLVCRIVNGTGFKIPRVNAGGYGNIARHLGEQLKALVLADHPYAVIITLDLKDVLEIGLFNSCKDLCVDLENQVREWLTSSQCEPRLQPLPEHIVFVIQVQKFESWIIADVEGLKKSGCLKTDLPQCSNTDKEVPDPATLLRKHMLPGQNQKNPRCAKSIISCLDPSVIRLYSPSFDKFYREVEFSYGCWCQACHLL